ncbi:MAG: GldG family protein [Bdellovibrionota bacterium]
MLYQCIGISGAIVFVYGLLTVAFTSVSQDWFIRSILILGLVGMATFVIKSLQRVWQKMVLIFLGANTMWVLFAIGQSWLWFYLVVPTLLLFGLFVFLRRMKFDLPLIGIGVVAVVLCGLFFQVLEEDMVSTTALVSAILLNVFAFMLAKNELVLTSHDDTKFTKRAIGYVYASIVFIIFVVINILSQDFHHEWDLTENKLNTLSEQSVKILESITDPLKITVFLKKDSEKKNYAKILLAFYENASKNVEVSFLDPDIEKNQSEKLGARDGDIVVTYKDQKYNTQSLSEEGITQAILKVSSTAGAHLCFLTGHGELALDGPTEDVRSLSALQKGLDNEGYTYQSITIMTDQIEPKCEILIVAGPQQEISKQEGQVIDQYLAGGGKAIFLLDPVFSNPNLGEKEIRLKTTGLEQTLFHWGIELGRNLILQKTIRQFEGEAVVSEITGYMYGNHPIVDPLKGKQTLFDGVQSVHGRPDFEGTTYDLIYSFGQGATWSKSNMRELLVDQNGAPGPDDLQGPIPFMVAAEKEGANAGDQTTQIIVAGDADFMSNALIMSVEYNYDLMLNMLGWLSGVEEKVSIRPKTFKTSAIELSREQSIAIFYVVIVLIPMLVLLFGINLWWIRRSRN